MRSTIPYAYVIVLIVAYLSVYRALFIIVQTRNGVAIQLTCSSQLKCNEAAVLSTTPPPPHTHTNTR